MRCLVTGGTGFIGSNLVKALVERGDDVIVITGSRPEKVPEGVEYLCLNLDGVDTYSIPTVDIVFHQAANNNTLDTDKRRMMSANSEAPMYLFHRLYDKGCRKYIYASSTAVYGDVFGPWKEDMKPKPLNVYGQSKADFDWWTMDVFSKDRPDTDIIGLRYCNVFGPGEFHKGPRRSMVSKILEKISLGQPVELFRDGEQKREWIYVKDVVRANLLAAEKTGIGIVNCATGNPISFNYMVKAIVKALGGERMGAIANINYIENPNAEAYQNLVSTDMTKAKEFLGFENKYTFEEALEDYIQSII